MRGMTWALIMLLTAGEAAAQDQYEGEDRREAVPPLPGGDDQGAAPQGEQTPPVQEDVIPQPAPDSQGGEALDGEARQPGFNRDATPQSTEEERREAEQGVQAYQGPATGETAPEETPETRLPGRQPDEQIDPHGPILPPDPDEIPDRRFETFETEADPPPGTPALEVPRQPTRVDGTPPL